MLFCNSSRQDDGIAWRKRGKTGAPSSLYQCLPLWQRRLVVCIRYSRVNRLQIGRGMALQDGHSGDGGPEWTRETQSALTVSPTERQWRGPGRKMVFNRRLTSLPDNGFNRRAWFKPVLCHNNFQKSGPGLGWNRSRRCRSPKMWNQLVSNSHSHQIVWLLV